MVFLGPEPQCFDHVDFAFSFKTTKHQSLKTYFFFPGEFGYPGFFEFSYDSWY